MTRQDREGKQEEEKEVVEEEGEEEEENNYELRICCESAMKQVK